MILIKIFNVSAPPESGVWACFAGGQSPKIEMLFWQKAMSTY